MNSKVLETLKTFSSMIKFSHSIFALPFAFIGMLIAANGLPDLRIVVLISIAMVSARSLAMALNRIIDADIDKRNPRTAGREIPSGKIRTSSALLFSLAMFLIFEISAYLINMLVFKLSFLVVVLFVIYPYTKRFSVICHLLLGAIDGLAPVGAYLAIDPHFSFRILFFGLSVAFWVTGFDMIYSMLDYDFDIKNRIYSVSSMYGKSRALDFSRLFHFVSFLLLATAGIVNGFGAAYYIALIVIGILLIYEQILAASMKKGKVYMAFFNINSFVGIIVLVAVAIELL